MIFLFTDFGHDGPYVGQMKAVLARQAPGVPVIDILHDAPQWDPRRAAYLLAALARESVAGDVWLAVVDPGVGGTRAPLIVDCDAISFVGPDNGLFAGVMRAAKSCDTREITWRPQNLSDTFHGRDLFAPIAAAVAMGAEIEARQVSAGATLDLSWPTDLAEIIYIDAYGNLMTGIDGARCGNDAVCLAAGRRLPYARTFAEVAEGNGFWTRNSCGLVEIAANQARADALLDLTVGDEVVFE